MLQGYFISFAFLRAIFPLKFVTVTTVLLLIRILLNKTLAGCNCSSPSNLCDTVDVYYPLSFYFYDF